MGVEAGSKNEVGSRTRLGKLHEVIARITSPATLSLGGGTAFLC